MVRGHSREGRKSQNTLTPTHTQLPKGLSNIVLVQGKLKILRFSLVSLSMPLPMTTAPRQCPQSLQPDNISRLAPSGLQDSSMLRKWMHRDWRSVLLPAGRAYKEYSFQKQLLVGSPGFREQGPHAAQGHGLPGNGVTAALATFGIC